LSYQGDGGIGALVFAHGEGGIGALVLAASQGDGGMGALVFAHGEGGIGALVFASACKLIALVNTSSTNTATRDHLLILPLRVGKLRGGAYKRSLAVKREILWACV
jgi:hypothetical protein